MAVRVRVMNPYGGMGETTVAVNLAVAAEREGFPTCLWDLCQTADATRWFIEEPRLHVRLAPTAYSLLDQNTDYPYIGKPQVVDVRRALVRLGHGLPDLLPSKRELRDSLQDGDRV